MSGGNLQGYTQLAYMEEEIDRELDGMELSARSVGAIQQMKMLYMNMYKLTKSLDYLVSGDIGEQQFYVIGINLDQKLALFHEIEKKKHTGVLV